MTSLSTSFNSLAINPSEEEIEAFFLAVKTGDIEMVTSMLDSYGQTIVTVKNSDGVTPLIRAVISGQKAVVGNLLDIDADVNTRDDGDWTPLMWAVKNGDTEIISMLLEKGADVAATTNAGMIVHAIAEINKNKAVEKILHEWPEKQRIQREQASVSVIYAGINEEIKVTSRLVLRAPHSGSGV